MTITLLFPATSLRTAEEKENYTKYKLQRYKLTISAFWISMDKTLNISSVHWAPTAVSCRERLTSPLLIVYRCDGKAASSFKRASLLQHTMPRQFLSQACFYF